ncbi:hypothetical protein HMN09_00934200 [Mycena chlorophos]|uniref:Uncharacterized protein n=1 Tax=Mycena chlorophos TaxID=658473 RepID=A0A8H6W3M3_MYCCL|nr:hypothetical protein HMN09_00934200 [Mycena chlorophos]
MPAIRHTRRDARRHNPIAVAPAPPPASGPGPAAIPALPSSSSSPSKGFSLTTSPFSLRRSKRSYLTDDLVSRGLDASKLLQSISSSMQYETLGIVASTCVTLFDTVDAVRTNKVQCVQLLERVHQIVQAIINLSGDGNGRGLKDFRMRSAVEQLSGTLTQLHEILQTQSTYNLFQRILRHAEIQDSLALCSEALQQALDVFSVQTSLITDTSLNGFRRAERARHEELVRALERKGFA